MTTMPDYKVCCLQSAISHYQEMSPSNLLVIVLILTGVLPVISIYAQRFMLPGMCFVDMWSCLRYTILASNPMERLYEDWCRRGCKYLRTDLCARVRDRCYTCRCY